MSSKENFSACKLEGSNLSMDPMQMKKKKKGGGYNVRKSLAWNKAFFTEEGVLDSDELSFIIGTPGNCSREVLSSISEERMNVPSEDLQAVGKNLFKDVPSASSKEAKNPVPFSLKHNSPASVHRATTSSASSVKVLSNHGFSRTGTRDSDCQPSLPSSSLKRPAKTHTFQSAMKGSKIPRTPVKKPGQSVVASSNRNAVVNASHVKQAQTAQSVSSIKQNVGVTASKRSTPAVQNKSKACSEAARQKKTNTVHMPMSFPSPTTLGPISSKMVTNSPQKATHDDASSFVAKSSTGSDKSKAKGVSLPQNTLVTGTALQCRQIRSIKPSGLRLPSPSLGFFGQGTGNFRPVQPNVKVPGVPKPICTKLIKSENICRVSHNQNEQEGANASIRIEGSIIQDVSEPSEPRRDELMTKIEKDFNEDLKFTVNQVAICLTGENKAVKDALLVESESSTDSVLMKSQSRDVFSCSVQCSTTTPITFAHDLSIPSKDCSEPKDVSPGEPREDQHLSVEVGGFIGQLEDLQNLSCGKISKADFGSPADGELKVVKSALSGETINLNSSMNYSKKDIAVEPMFQETEIVADVILTPRRHQDNAKDCSQTSDVIDSVTKDAKNGESDSKGSRSVSTVCQSEYFICEDRYKVVNDSNSERATSCFTDVQPSSKLDKHLAWKHDEDPEDKDGLFVNKENLSDETKLAVPEDIHSFVEEPCSEMDTTLCTDEDTDLMERVCSEKISTKNTLKIIPTINAAPFSDEWLAAIEAAGEDILTIKSGAVQNSPTEKVVPEPRLWSPVKRRNNSVGPFDCTKFTSH